MDIERLKGRISNPIIFDQSPSCDLNRDEVKQASLKLMGVEKKEGDGIDHDAGLDATEEPVDEESKIIS